MTDILANGKFTDIQPTATILHAHPADSGNDSSMDEAFETPPTSPLKPFDRGRGLGIELDQLQPAQKDSKTTFFESTANNVPIVNKKRPFPDSEPMAPPAVRKFSSKKKSDLENPTYAVPSPPPEIDHLTSQRSLSRSFDNASSVSSSFTSVSPAWTSPNTSFCSESIATSFDSTAEETDTTVKPSISQLRNKKSLDQPALWPGIMNLNQPKDYNRAYAHSKDSVGNSFNKRDLNLNTVTGAPGSSKTSSHLDVDARNHLLNRLASTSPFGNSPDPALSLGLSLI